MRWLLQLVLGLAVLGGTATWCRAQSVSAQFQPEIIGIGEVSSYLVSFENLNLSSPPRLNPPGVPGLRVLGVNPQTSQNTTFVNGRMSSRVSFIWQVTASEEGTFTVPAQTVMVNGERLVIPEATLRAVPASERDDGLFRLEWEVSDKTHYVGESIPALLKLYVRGDVQGPELGGLSIRIPEGLLESPDQPPEQTRERIDGVTYAAVYWSKVLTPIKPDTFSLEASVEILYQDPGARRRSLDLFGRLSAQRKLVLAPDTPLEVREVPTSGRLPGFNGAVGNFTSRVELEPREVRAGEPLTLRVHLEGSGNFDRVAAPEIPASPQWRVYPPKVNFTPADGLGFKGTKTFEYLLIPGDTSLDATPSIPWAAFDPYREEFVDQTVPPQPLTVNPAPDGGSTVSFAQGWILPESGQARRPPDAWRPPRAELGTLTPGVVPAVRQHVFFFVNGTLLLLALGLGVFRWQRRRLVDDEAYARRVTASRTVRRWLKEAQTHASAGEPEAYYTAAQRTVQEAVGRHFPRGRRPASLTLPEIEARLIELGLAEEQRAAVRTLFEAGDALRYAGLASDTAALRDSVARLEDILRALP
jgi:hypothetical protein